MSERGDHSFSGALGAAGHDPAQTQGRVRLGLGMLVVEPGAPPRRPAIVWRGRRVWRRAACSRTALPHAKNVFGGFLSVEAEADVAGAEVAAGGAGKRTALAT